MPSEQATQSQSHVQSHTRPPLSHRSTSGSDSPYGGSPHGKTSTKLQLHKHVVGGRGHARVPSTKALHKTTGSKVHIARDESASDLKKLARNASATSLKKNSSHVSLKRNKSAADVHKRPKSSHSQKKATGVHFEIGDTDPDADVEQDEGWEEASQSASPALSRAVSSGKASRNTSAPQSPTQQQSSEIHAPTTAPSEERQSARNPSADAKAITQRLLQRTPSHNTTKMSLATATPTHNSSNSHSPEKSQSSVSIPNSTPKIGSNNAEVVSRFVGSSGTPNENSSFLHNRRSTSSPHRSTNSEDVKRAESMGNLTHPDSDNEDDDESVLAPRSRKSSTTHTYVPPQQSRTQQKLWLQRASSNIEPQQMVPGIANLQPGSTLVGAGGYDSRDPRIRIQLERTGLEYLVVRRYQDPVGKALKRLSQLPGADKNRRIPPSAQNGNGNGHAQALKNHSNGVGRAGHGLSQSISQQRMGNQTPAGGSSFEGTAVGGTGSQDDASLSGRGGDGDDGVGAVLRGMWEKSWEMSGSAE